MTRAIARSNVNLTLDLELSRRAIVYNAPDLVSAKVRNKDLPIELERHVRVRGAIADWETDCRRVAQEARWIFGIRGNERGVG